MKRETSLLFRTLALVMGALVTFSFVLALIVAFGSGPLLSSWEKRENEALRVFLADKLSELAKRSESDGSAISEEAIEAALRGLPFEPETIFVLTPMNVPLYHYRRAEGKNGASRGLGQNLLQRVQNISDWHQIATADGRPILRFSASLPAFNQKESNRLLLNAAGSMILWGSLTAAVIAAGFAYFFAKPMARHARSLAHGLERLGAGERNLELDRGSVEELNRIAVASGQLQRILRVEEDLRRRWASDVAHDLRTPITVLKGSLEAMIDGVFEPSRLRLEDSYKEILILERLVQDLALLTRLETPGFRAEPKELQSLPLLSGLADRFRDHPKREQRDIRVVGENVVLQADPALLERALSNIIENALHYGEKTGCIVLHSQKAGETGIALSVENKGTIDPELLPRVFDRLVRGDSARESPGSGLGLSIARAIAEAHHAELSVRSEAGATRFSLRFS